MAKRTRNKMANELLGRLARGPSLDIVAPVEGTAGNMEEQTLVALDCERRVRVWIESWILPDVVALIPELRQK